MDVALTWLECRCRFALTSWRDLSSGDVIYVYRPKVSDRRALGPFTVLEPVWGRLRDMNGIELQMSPDAVPLVLHMTGGVNGDRHPPEATP